MPRSFTPRMRATVSVCLALALLSGFAWLVPAAAPTAASAQSGESLFVRKLALRANDLAYSPSTGMIYASVPSSVGAGGNSITPINPATGAVGAPVFVGSEPNRLALSSDGNTLYAALDGAFSVRRFDVQTQTPGAQFPVGTDSFFGHYVVNDMAVAPGEPDTVAIVRHRRGVSPPGAGVAVYENGVQRPKTGPGHIEGADYLDYSDSPSTLYGGGFYYGLRTMTIDQTGVASVTRTAFDVRARIKYAGGLVFSSSGQVINPVGAGALLGTFSGANTLAFVPDTSAGRAYYLVREGSSGNTLTLKAFDINTYLLVGSQTITGVTGDPTTLVRWGTNGLAFRTSTGEVFIIQTNLIPSATPVPTPTPGSGPTPTPTPTPAAAFVRQFSIPTGGMAYNPERQAIYVSLPSSAGAAGNSVAQFDPVAGQLVSPVFVGSEPKRMAFSDDGQTMYVGLSGAAAVRRLDLQTLTPGLQFSLGADSFSGPYFPDYLAVMPGAPNTVAVSRTGSSSSGGAAVFDNGVQRAQTAGSGSLQFGLSASRLYAGGGPVQRLNVAANGLTLASTIPAGRGGQTSYFDRSRGLLFGSGGDVYDPEAGTIVGQFTGLNFNSAMAVDPAAGRVYFLTADSNSSTAWRVIAYDMNTFLPVGFTTLSGVSGTPTDLVRWGTNGLAFRTDPGFSSAESRIVVVQTALVDASQPVPTPTPVPSPTPTPTPPYVPTFVRKVSLPAGDVLYNEATQSLYATVGSAAGAGGNSIVPINPATGAAGAPVFVGSEPGRMALADDGRTLYAYLDGAKALRRFDVQTMAPGLQFSIGAQAPADFEVMPGSPQSVAVSPGVNFSTGPTVYDDGVARPKIGTGSFYAVLPIEFGASPSVLYGYDSYSSGFELVKFTVDASGVTTNTVTYNLMSGYSTDIKFAGGLIYGSSGRVVDPEARKIVGTFGSGGTALAVDPALGRIFFISGDGFGSGKVLRAFDLNTYLPLGSVTLQNVPGNPTRLVRWGTNGLAFRTTNSNSGSGSVNDGGVYIIQSALVSPSEPVPTGLNLAGDRLNAFEYNSTFPVVVTRTGDVSGATSVNYATSDGTATAGSDYTAASGTLTFAAGELSKTVNVTIRQDNVYEGNETFTFTLSSPTGGAILSAPSSAVVTLVDDDARPTISVSDVRMNEGNSGTTDASFLVSLSNPSFETVSVNFATGDGTASSASDYVAASGTLSFPPLTTSALVKVKVNGDLQIEPDETFGLTLSNAVNASFIARAQAICTIVNDDAPGRFQFSGPTYRIAEDGGSAAITVHRVSGLSGTASINYATSNGTATAGSDYTAASGTLTFAEGESVKTFSVPITNDASDEPDETVLLALSNPTGGALLGVPSAATLTIENDDRPVIQFSAAHVEVGEAAGHLTLTVTRSGDPSTSVSVNYATSDVTATELADYNLTLGTLRFAPGETQKQIGVLVTNDTHVEAVETFLVTLSGPSGSTLGSASAATVAINSDDAEVVPNPLGDPFNVQFFVRQHYHDFLNREPDAGGLEFWSNIINDCSPKPQCVEPSRVNVSAAFFLSIEFQETGFLVYRLHQAAYNTQETLRLRTFLADSQELGRGVQVGIGDWRAQLEANKKAFTDRFAASPQFVTAFQGMSNAEYVDALAGNTFDPREPGTGGALTAAERAQLVADLNESRKTRAEVLRAVAENGEFARRQRNKAFVLMQYFGYLRRSPDSGRDTDFSGYNFWLAQLERHNGNYVTAELVKAFILSLEYKARFGR